MPKDSLHISQVNHNLNLLNSVPETHNDWKVTIIFYIAVHVIEKFLATKDIHTKSHSERFDYVRAVSELKKIASEYHTLYMTSIKSRYECKSFTSKDVEGLMVLLEKIQKGIPA